MMGLQFLSESLDDPRSTMAIMPCRVSTEPQNQISETLHVKKVSLSFKSHVQTVSSFSIPLQDG